MSKKKNEELDIDFYNEASVPTPHEQEDVSAIDMISGAVEAVIEDIQEDVGLQDKPRKS
ncbi:hypothetical protein [Cohnella kolymensis]|uniref:hypothetical protein n=1 Tax=Cohnella kolymensis TaxID=1590652 RepID=UPI000B04E118|nr:hypothetical protein [Cohnella kolymensis]